MHNTANKTDRSESGTTDTRPATTPSHSPWSAAFLLGAAGIYVLVFFLLYRLIRTEAVTAVIVLAMAVGWQGGLRAGVLAGLLGLPLNILLLNLAGQSDWNLALQGLDGLVHVVAVVAGAITGRLHDLRDRLQQELAEHERTEQALRQSQAQLASIIASAMDAIITLDADQRIVVFNAAAEKMFGCSAAQALGQPLDRFIPERFRSAHREHIRAFGETGATQRAMGALGEVYALRADGQEFSTETSIAQIQVAGQKFYNAIVRDITERKRADEALRRQLKELTVLQTVAAFCAEAAHEDALIERVTQIIGAAFYPDNFGVLLLDAANRVLHSHPSYRTAEGVPDTSAIPLGQGVTGRVAATGQPWRVPDVTREPTYLAVDPHTRAELCVPLKIGERVIGVLNAESTQLDAFSPADERLLTTIAGQSATAIERLRTEHVLQEREKRFRALIENSADAFVLLSADAALLYVSPSVSRILGYASAELIGRNGLGLVHPDDREQIVGLLAKALQESERIIPVQVRIQHKDGSWRWLEAVGRNLLAEPSVQAIVVNFRDITERKQAQQRLDVQHAVMRVLAEAPTLSEATPKILQAICSSLGWQAGELWGIDREAQVLCCIEIWHTPSPDIAEFAVLSRSFMFAPNVGLPGHIWASGEPFWITDVVEDAKFPRAALARQVGLHGAFGFPIRCGSEILGVMDFFSHRIESPDQDLLKMMATVGGQIGQFIQRKRAEESLRESETHFRTVVESLGEGLLITDLDDVVVYMNPRVTALTGYTADELLGQPAYKVLLPPEQWSVLFQRNEQRKRGIAERYELQGQRKDGSLIWVEVNATPYCNPAGEIIGTLGATADITERKRAEEALREAEAKYRTLVEQIPAIVYITSLDETTATRYINPQSEAMLGYTPDEWLADPTFWVKHLHPDDRDRMAAAYAHASTTDELFDAEYRMLARDGRVVWLHDEAVLVREGDRPFYLQGIALDITERKRAEEILRQQNEYLAALNETALALMNRLDLDDLLQAIIRRAAALTNTPHGYIDLITADGTEWEARVATGVFGEFLGARQKIGEGVAGQVWQTEQPVVIDDYDAWHSRMPRFAGLFHSIAAVPLKSGQRVVGLFGLAYLEKDRRFTHDEIALLSRFAELASLALDNAQLYSAAQQELAERRRAEAQLARQNQQLEALSHMGQTVLASLELPVVLQGVIDKVLPLLGARCVCIALLEDQELVVAASGGAGAKALQGQRLPVGVAAAGQVLRSGKSLQTSGASVRALVYPEVENIIGCVPASLLAVPLRAGRNVIGVMEALHIQSDAFSSDDLRLLEAAASWAAIAIDNARRHEELLRRAEEEIIWSTVGKIVISMHDLDELLARVLYMINEKMQVETGSVLLRAPETEELFFAKILRGNEEQFSGLRVRVGQGIAGWVVQTGQAARVADAAADPRFYATVDRLTGFTTRTVICAPLIVKNEVIGVIELLNKQGGAFTPDDLRLLESLAAPVAIAIQNTRLHQRVRQQLVEVTELLQRVEQIKNEWEQTVDAIGEGIVLVDEHSRIVRANRTLAAWLHTTSEALVGQYCYQAIHGCDAPREDCPHAQLIVARDRTRSTDLNEPRLGGMFHFTTYPLRNPEGTFIGTVNVLKDITVEKRLQAQLIQSEKMSATGRLAASIAHEINNPLQAIQGCLDMAQTFTTNPERQERYLTMAKSELERLATIVQRMLDFYRPAVGTPTAIDVRAVVNDVLALSAKPLQHAKVSAQTEWEGDLPKINGVANQLKQVFLNLILNAVDAMSQGGNLLLHGRTLDEQGKKWLTLAVADSGMGIPPDQLDKIFEPFYTSKSAGTGLGLAISHNIITNHGGRLTVTSVVGRGSTFTVWLPVEK